MSGPRRPQLGLVGMVSNMKRGTWRGHSVSEGLPWVYSDTGSSVTDDIDRPCGSCGLANTPEGYDGCLGFLPGVENACCGHGDEGDAYIVLVGGERLAGAAAIQMFERTKARPAHAPVERAGAPTPSYAPPTRRTCDTRENATVERDRDRAPTGRSPSPNGPRLSATIPDRGQSPRSRAHCPTVPPGQRICRTMAPAAPLRRPLSHCRP